MGIENITEVFRRLKKEKQEHIFGAAAEEFAGQGYKNASMNTLAKVAGVSKGSIFQYFRSKESLFDFVLNAATDKVKDYLRTVRDNSAEQDFFSRMKSLIHAGFRFIKKHPHLARIYFHVLQSGDAPYGTKKLTALHRKGQIFLEEIVRDGIKRGELRSDIDIEKTVYLLNTISNSLLRSYYIAFLAHGSDLYHADERKLNDWVETTVDFIKRGLQL
jgi:AcrR family transcriptional regulator